MFTSFFSPEKTCHRALESCTSSWYSSSSSAFVLDGTPPMAATAVPHLGSLGTIRSCRRWVELKELQLTPKKIQDMKPLSDSHLILGDSTHRKFIKWPSWVMNKRKLTSHRSHLQSCGSSEEHDPFLMWAPDEIAENSKTDPSLESLDDDISKYITMLPDVHMYVLEII